MKHLKSILFLFLAVLTYLTCHEAKAAEKKFEGKGEVVSVDPMYKRITIKHGAIKNFEGDGETEFFVKSEKELKDLARYDLVDFTIAENKGDTRIESLKKTGVAEQPQEGFQIGEAAQGALESTAGAVKTITSPIPPVNTVASAAVDGTTNATGAVLEEAPDLKKKF